ncbi:MAG: hypothetical protein CMI54_06220 [Parcubacteria group bacterium]|jgi:hypothetical protein|nr:hypothetical protein [Parcubacteria group bacterium]|tara:strand:+ start:4548 stop:4757 length:210 start_codon:yes stop_codon:yes gene_type:complete
MASNDKDIILKLLSDCENVLNEKVKEIEGLKDTLTQEEREMLAKEMSEKLPDSRIKDIMRDIEEAKKNI